MEIAGRKDLIGAKPLDVLFEIVCLNPEIKFASFWKYTDYPFISTELKTGNIFWLERGSLSNSDSINQIIYTLRPDQQLAVGSKVKLSSGKYAHIPLMDFSLHKTPTNLEVVQQSLKDMRQSDGWILETGESYNYWGSILLTDEGWINFMGKSLYTGADGNKKDSLPIVDSRFIGHSLIRGCNTLRITTRANKIYTPTVVASI